MADVKTDPASLKELADALDSWATLVEQGYEVPAAARTMWTVRDVLRALAVEKEAPPDDDPVQRVMRALSDLNPDVSNTTRAEAAIRALRPTDFCELRPGDRLPGGLVVVRGWQPFDTAPRDGTEVLVFRPDNGAFTALYDADQEIWFSTCGTVLTYGIPTLWMSLSDLEPAVRLGQSELEKGERT